VARARLYAWTVATRAAHTYPNLPFHCLVLAAGYRTRLRFARAVVLLSARGRTSSDMEVHVETNINIWPKSREPHRFWTWAEKTLRRAPEATGGRALTVPLSRVQSLPARDYSATCATTARRRTTAPRCSRRLPPALHPTPAPRDVPHLSQPYHCSHRKHTHTCWHTPTPHRGPFHTFDLLRPTPCHSMPDLACNLLGLGLSLMPSHTSL